MIKKSIAVGSVIMLALTLTASPASAFWFNSDDVTVSNNNSAYVKNVVETEADSGDNYAGGSTGGQGGQGGSVQGVSNDNNDAQGGSGGNGGIGGTVLTGNASATSDVSNMVNRNDTRVSSCGCEGNSFSGSGDVSIRNRNRVAVKNYIETEAETGDNKAKGSQGGNGGNAGYVGGFGNDGNEVDGGSGGDSSDGGYISTGSASARTEVLNVVNKNITRVRR